MQVGHRVTILGIAEDTRTRRQCWSAIRGREDDEKERGHSARPYPESVDARNYLRSLLHGTLQW